MSPRKIHALAGILGVALLAGPVQGQTFQEVVGHDFGERVTLHHEMVQYLQRLAKDSPRVRVVKQGESWEGRDLLLAIVTSPENLARLDEIQRNAQHLSDPRRTSVTEATAIISTQPAITWFGGSIHGFELSGAEGALKLLEHLATRDDPETLELLRNLVILIDPMLNPDGRDALASFNAARSGRLPNPSRASWNNDFTSWESGSFRTGHYFFDTNRDWMALTQVETRARMPTRNEWRPQIAVDMHESGSEAEFYFDPPSGVCCKFFPEFAQKWEARFGVAFADAFDAAGFGYTTGDMWVYSTMSTTGSSSYHGAVGMLFEQAGTRGLAIERGDGSVRRLSDGLEHQYLAALTAARFASAHRVELLRDYYDAHAAAVADGLQGVRRFLITPEGDPNLRAEVANLLIRHAIEVDVLTEAARLGGVHDREGRAVGTRDFPAGTLVVDAAQPRNRLVREFFEPKWDAPVTESAFPVPFLFDVQSFGASDGRALPVRRLSEPLPVAGGSEGPLSRPAGPAPSPGTQLGAERARYAYLVDGRQAAALGALYHLLDRGFRAGVMLDKTRVQGVEYPGGTVVVRVGENGEGVHAAIRELADRYRLEVRGVNTGQAEQGGRVLGSENVLMATRPDIAILAEGPVDVNSFGGAWYTLDRLYEIPATVVRAGSLADARLSDFDVLVLPELSGPGLRQLLREEGLERMRAWVRGGGTLVAIGSAGEFAREEFDLGLRSWYETPAGQGIQPRSLSGAIFPAIFTRGHWLSGGYDGPLPVFVTSNRIYAPPEGPTSGARRVVARYAPTHPAAEAGFPVPPGFDRLANAVVAYEERVGDGRVVVLAEDPNFRGYWRGANRLFLNAVILGPSAR